MAANDAQTCRISILCSGSGTNLQAIIDAVQNGQISNSKIIKVIVNRAKAFSVQRAKDAGIPHDYFNLVSQGFVAKGEKDEAKLKAGRARYDAELAQKVLGDKPDLVVLAGWMHIGRAYEDFKAGKLENNRTGAMIHYVIAQVDRGEPILVQEVEVLRTDKLEDLEKRMHDVEHDIIVKATAQVSQEVLAKKQQKKQ
ncbi:hypothetical protein COL26b_006897 [Colletotrichum chrysophilum]|uniref:uncharacterized protein n=1 Tax=Colletotrichum chrysophilum TaxID=1836956 RepID=UPI002301DD67|nr:uncharacterized protein COL26b_006897 [Colletotrichum chrysophilum]KAJ0374881.1 hypothetical protein COL26b_006897 [Colletotrichum chrysophilum]